MQNIRNLSKTWVHTLEILTRTHIGSTLSIIEETAGKTVKCVID